MDNEQLHEAESQPEITPEEVETSPVAPYAPRPKWQVWAARIGLVAFLILLFVYYFTMFSGGGR